MRNDQLYSTTQYLTNKIADSPEVGQQADSPEFGLVRAFGLCHRGAGSGGCGVEGRDGFGGILQPDRSTACGTGCSRFDRTRGHVPSERQRCPVAGLCRCGTAFGVCRRTHERLGLSGRAAPGGGSGRCGRGSGRKCDDPRWRTGYCWDAGRVSHAFGHSRGCLEHLTTSADALPAGLRRQNVEIRLPIVPLPRLVMAPVDGAP